MTADNQVTLDDFMCRVPENGVVAIPADLYAKVCDALKLPAINSGDEVESVARAIYERGGFPNPTWDNLAEKFKTLHRRSARAALAAMDRAPGVDMPERIANRMGATFVPRPETIDGVETGNTVAPNTPEPRPVEAGEVDVLAIAEFVDKYYEPWGAWKTAWWESEVSDDAAFSEGNALKHVANMARKIATHRQQSLSAARAEIEAMIEAIDVADRLIERGYGVNVPGDWNAAVSKVQRARAALSTDQGREGEADV